MPPAWHTLAPDDALARTDGRREGLTAAEARARLAAHGPNEAARARPEPVWSVLWRQVADPMIVVLIVAGGIAIVLGEGVDAAVVFAVVIANALIGFLQEHRAGRAIRALAAMVPERATVVRDGAPVAVPSAEVVPGDVLRLRRGDRVAADARLLEVRGLEVDESALTGESLPVAKGALAVPGDAPVADRTCVAHGGTIVTGGRAWAVVVATGEQTELGRISAMLRETTRVETPLTRALGGLARLIAAAVAVVAAVMLAVGLARGYAFADAALAAISLAVAAIPEGLPAIVTIALAIGVQRMARRNAVVRRLPAVETLGSTTIICTDKTGTLTRNEMRVTALWPAGGAERDVLRAGALCSDGAADGSAGSPTERALLRAAAEGGLDAAAERAAAPRLDAVPFEPEHKFMATLHAQPDSGDALLVVKGAPEAVLPRCTGGDVAAAGAAVERFAADGMRVLALASRRLHAPAPLDDGALSGLRVVGLAAISDPPREDAVAAVAACRRAGVEVKMITGDHAATGRAIGRAVGLGDGGVFTGRDLDALDDEALAGAARTGTVFARVAPEHKLRLVRALQAQRAVVAMTGDGVNDAPALQQSDIGVAMGVAGTAVAREAADIVLADDRFASIAAAVEEGRRVYDNLQKAIAFVLPTNLGEALVLLVAVLTFPFADGEPLLPITPTQVLWVNLIATVTLALPLAVEAPERGLMERPPRPPGMPVVTRFLLARTILVSLLMAVAAIALFFVALDVLRDDGVARLDAVPGAQTMVVTTIVFFQVVYLLECRSLRHTILAVGLFSNPWAWAGIGAILALQAAFVYLPPLQDVFGSAALGAGELALAAGAALVLVPAVAVEEAIRRRRAPAGTA